MKQRKVPSSFFGPCLAQACYVTGNTCCPFAAQAPSAYSPSWCSLPAQELFQGKGEWRLWFSAPQTLFSPPPNSSGYYVDRGGDWVKNADESSNRAHRKRGRASHSSFPFALHSGRTMLGAVLKWYLVIIALAGHCSSEPVTQGHCKVIWTRGAVESLGTIHRPIIMRLIPKKVRTP